MIIRKPFFSVTKIIIFACLGIIIFALLGSGIAYKVNISKPVSNQDQKIYFEVKKGESRNQIADNLEAKGLIVNARFFAWYGLFHRYTFQIGLYYLSPSMNIPEIAQIMASGKVSEFKIVIPEGWRIKQIDDYLAKNGRIQKREFEKLAGSFEGYLFPDTYRLDIEASVNDIIEKMRQNFTKKTADLNLDKNKIIIASIVEREAKKDEDRAKIAGVYNNRLAKGMKLEADPTVQYAKGSWEAITIKDYKDVNSPYNTYLHEGLPPTPICNSGLASLEAAVNPAKTDALYFFHLSDGTTIYSNTEEEHSQNKEKYRDKISK